MIETAPTKSAEAAAVARPSHQGGPVVPGGLLVEGSCYKRFHVRELTGADEERLTGRSYHSGSEQVTDFLANVIEGIEGHAGAVTNELVENMLIGDRDYLLLWLRQTTVGDRVNQVMRCPNPACAQKVDVEFFLSELAVKRVETVRPSYDLVLSSPAFADDATSNRGAFRLPTGKDQADLEAFLAEGEGPRQHAPVQPHCAAAGSAHEVVRRGCPRSPTRSPAGDRQAGRRGQPGTGLED